MKISLYILQSPVTMLVEKEYIIKHCGKRAGHLHFWWCFVCLLPPTLPRFTYLVSCDQNYLQYLWVQNYSCYCLSFYTWKDRDCHEGKSDTGFSSKDLIYYCFKQVSCIKDPCTEHDMFFL